MTNGNPYAFRVRPGMRQGLPSEVPLPTRLVSNEEFPPLPQTAAQREVEERILAAAGRLAPRLGLSRREFLRTSGGMAASFLAMNAVFGRFFDVLPKSRRPSRRRRRSARATPFFIFDVQLHYVGAAYDPTNAEAERKGAVSKAALLGLRKRSQRLNPKLASDSGTLADLSWQNFIKEVFLDSETAIGLISTPPGPVSPGSGGPAEGDDAHPRRDQPHHAVAPDARPWPGDAAARPGRSRLHGAAGGNAEGRRLEGATPAPAPRDSITAGSSTTRRSPTRCSRKRASSAFERFCVHKGLPLGPVADYNHPRDLIKAAKDFPDIDFLALPLRTAGRDGAEADRRGAVDHRVLRDEEEGAGHQEHLHGAGVHLRRSSSRPTRPPARICSAR